jgi:hypothetical protein
MAGWAAARLDELPDVPTASDPRDPAWKPIRHFFGLQAFGINAYVARAAGDALVSEHDESSSGHEELYLGTAGPHGSCSTARSSSRRRARSSPSRTRACGERQPRSRRGATVIAVGSRPGCFESTWRLEHYAGMPTA